MIRKKYIIIIVIIGIAVSVIIPFLYFFVFPCNLEMWSYETEAYPYTVAISSDGTFIAAGTADTTIGGTDNYLYFFERSSNTPLWEYQLEEPAQSVAISSNGSYVVVSDREGNIYFFNNSIENPKTAYVTEMWGYRTYTTRTIVDISLDGRYILAAGDSGDNVFLLNNSYSINKEPIRVYPKTGDTTDLAISGNGQFAIVGDNNWVRVFNNSISAPLSPIWSSSLDAELFSIATSFNGSRIVASSLYGIVYYFANSIGVTNHELWNFTTGGSETKVDLSSDGRYIAAGGGGNNRICLISNSKEELWYYQAVDYTYSVVLSSNGEVAAGCKDGYIYYFDNEANTANPKPPLWQCRTGGIQGFLGSSVFSVAISSDGRYAVAGSSRNMIHLYDSNRCCNSIPFTPYFLLPLIIGVIWLILLTRKQIKTFSNLN